MTKAAGDELAQLQAVWLARFGEPPPIVAEPEIMRRVLARVLDRTEPKSPRTVRSEGLEEEGRMEAEGRMEEDRPS